MFHGIDHHWKDPVFATCGQQVDIWDEGRADPVRSFTWGVDTIHSVSFNSVEVMAKTFKYMLIYCNSIVVGVVILHLLSVRHVYFINFRAH